MTKEAERIGGMVWRKLIDAGGYVYTASDGAMSIHFNRGYSPTKELSDLVRTHRRELRLFVEAWHARDDARLAAPSPRCKVLPAQTKRNTPNAKVSAIY